MSHDEIVEKTETVEPKKPNPFLDSLQKLAKRLELDVTIEPHKSMFRVSNMPYNDPDIKRTYFGNYNQTMRMLLALRPEPKPETVEQAPEEMGDDHDQAKSLFEYEQEQDDQARHECQCGGEEQYG